MNHQSHKVRFGKGRDADRMLMRKLCYNFLRSGKLTTTQHKAKALKSEIDRLVSRLSEPSESNKKYVAQRVLDARMCRELFTQLADTSQKITGGYVSIARSYERSSDGAVMATVSWAHGISFLPAQQKEKKDSSASTEKELKDATPVEKKQSQNEAKPEKPTESDVPEATSQVADEKKAA